MFRFKFHVCWQTEYKNVFSIRYFCPRTVLDITQVDLTQDSRTVKHVCNKYHPSHSLLFYFLCLLSILSQKKKKKLQNKTLIEK